MRLNREAQGIFLSLGLGVLFGALYYFVLEDLVIALVVLALTFAFLLFLQLTFVRKYRLRRIKEHEDYRFIHSFVASLSTTGSLETAYQSALEGADEELLKVARALEDRRIEERVSYLAGYFRSDTFSMFVSLFSLYQEQGGNFLKMAAPLLTESARAEEENNRKDDIGKRTLREFCLLWGMACLILLTLRFALSGFYEELREMQSYRLSSLLFLPIFYLSSYLFLATRTGERLLPRRRK